MNTLNIGVCGGPNVGKHNLLMALAKHSGGPSPEVYPLTKDINEKISKMTVISGENQLHFKSVIGEVNQRQESFKYILTLSQLLIYVFAPKGSADQVQDEYFNEYCKIAKPLNKLWTNCVWLSVLNTSNLGKEFPLIHNIPAELSHNSIVVNISDGNGVNNLLDRIYKLNTIKQSFV